MYPRLVLDLNKFRGNLDAVAKITKEDGKCDSLMIVTKSFCADPVLCRMVAEHPMVDFLADSRVKNVASYTEMAHEYLKKTVLLRIPMHCEVEEVVRYVDLSFNSEISTIRLLNEAAKKAGKVHSILLMIDMGDLREGIFFRNEDVIMETVEEILGVPTLRMYNTSNYLLYRKDVLDYLGLYDEAMAVDSFSKLEALLLKVQAAQPDLPEELKTPVIFGQQNGTGSVLAYQGLNWAADKWADAIA